MKPFNFIESTLQLPSPLQSLNLDPSHEYEIKIKRDDLIHPLVSGNKWRKLKYNLQFFVDGEYDGIVTYGGPFSNHLYAMAAACHILQIPCYGLVRSNGSASRNPTIKRCKALGMSIIEVSPNDYARRYESMNMINRADLKQPYIIPEGGSNELSLKGTSEIVTESDFKPDYIVLSVGTAATMAGICMSGIYKVIGISPFKKGKVYIPYLDKIAFPNEVLYDWALKGYGRYDSKIVSFINEFWAQYHIPLDPIYNAKAMLALVSLVNQKAFPTGSRILYIHTGGLQGIEGFNLIHGHKGMITIPEKIYSPTADQ